MKNIKLIQAKNKDKDSIVDFLIKNHIYKTKKENWLNLFESKWCDIDNYGFVLIDENDIVGYFGLIFSNQKYFNNQYTANIHSWVVKPEYRGHSLMLLKEIIKLNNVFFISHSTINSILKIYFRYNWKILDENYYYIFGSLYPNKKIKIENITENNFNSLSSFNKKIYLDHSKYNAIFFKIIVDNEEIFIIGKSKKIKRIIKFFEILYVSNIELFNSYGYKFINSLKSKTNSLFCRVDSRFIRNQKKMISIKYKMKNTKKIFFSKDVIKNENLCMLNNLYSEIFLLDT